jgi:hypothetical protein
VDFKTGTEDRVSAERMATSGASLQLGVYLAAVQSLGAAGGRVWMLKPVSRGNECLEMSDLSVALGRLTQLDCHLETGCYGSLTPDRTEYTHGFEWPLACVPVGRAVLLRKFAATFGVAPEGEATHE